MFPPGTPPAHVGGNMPYLAQLVRHFIVALGFIVLHFQRWRSGGDMSRAIRIEGSVAYVPLTKGYEAIIDVEDVPLVEGWNWSAREERRRDGTVRIIYAGRNGFNPTKKKVVHDSDASSHPSTSRQS